MLFLNQETQKWGVASKFLQTFLKHPNSGVSPRISFDVGTAPKKDALGLGNKLSKSKNSTLFLFCAHFLAVVVVIHYSKFNNHKCPINTNEKNWGKFVGGGNLEMMQKNIFPRTNRVLHLPLPSK